MKKKTLKIFSIFLSIGFMFGASSCAFFDSVQFWFEELQYEKITDEEEQNEAFQEIKNAYQNTYNYKGTFTATLDGYISESYEGKQKHNREFSAIVSADPVQKRYYRESNAGSMANKTKEYQEEDSYYVYRENDTVMGSVSKTYEKSSSIQSNYEYATTNIGSRLTALFAADNLSYTLDASAFIELSPLFYAESFTDLKEVSEKFFEDGQTLRRNRVKEIFRFEEYSSKYNYFNKTKDSETKAETSLSVLKSKEGEYLLKMVGELKTPTLNRAVEKQKVSLRFETWLFEKEGKITKCKIIEKYTNSSDDYIRNKVYSLNFDYSFAIDKFNAFKIDENVQLSSDSSDSDIATKDLAFVIENQEVLLKFEININESVENFFTKLSNGQGLAKEYGSLSGVEGLSYRGIYTDKEKTQYYDVTSASMDEFLLIEKFYIDIKLKDGFAMVTESTKSFIGEIESKYFLCTDEHFKYSDVKILNLAEENEYVLDSNYNIFVNGVKTNSTNLLCEEKEIYFVEYVRPLDLFNYCFSKAKAYL